MNESADPSSTDSIAARTVRIEARPEPLELALAQTAIVVVDLQNGYASPGGYRSLIGQDVGPARKRSRTRCGCSMRHARPA